METDPNFSGKLARALPMGAGLLARDGAILALGSGMATSIGGPGANLVGVPFRDQVAAPDRGRFDAALKALRLGGKTRMELSVRLRAGNFSAVPMRLTLEAVRDHGETVAVALEGPKRPDAPIAARSRRAEAERRVRMLDFAAGQGGHAPWFLDPATGRFTHFSALAALIGLPADEPVPDFDGLMARIHPEDRPVVMRELEELLSGEEPKVRANLRIRHQEGQWVNCTTIASLWEGEDGGAPLICAVTSEIATRAETTARHAPAQEDSQSASADALQNPDLLACALQNSTVVPWSRDPETGAVWIAPHLSNLLGLPPDFVIDDKTLAAITHPDDVALAAADLAALVAGQTGSFAHDIRLRRADGSWGRFTSRGRALDRGERGRPRLVCGTMTEIDGPGADPQGHKSAGEIHAAPDRLNAVADKFPGALFAYNVTPECVGHFHYTSARFAEILGIDIDRVDRDGDAAFNGVHPDDLVRMRESARTAVRDGAPVALEARVDHPSKGPRLLMISASPTRESDGSVTWFGTLLDITDENATEPRAADAAAGGRTGPTQLDSFAEGAPRAVFEDVTDANGDAGADSLSNGLPAMSGVSRAARESDPAVVTRHIPAHDGDALQAAVTEAAASRKPVNLAHRTDHPEHGLRRVLTAGTPETGEDGSVTIQGSVQDATGRPIAGREDAEAADQGRESDERVMRLCENAPGASFELRCFADGRKAFHFVSSTLLDIMGVALADVQADADNMFAWVPQEDLEKIRAAIARIAVAGGRVETTHRVVHPEKGQRWVLVVVDTQGEPDGGARGYGSVVDITERLATERREAKAAQDLARAHERLTYLTDGATVGLFETRLGSDGRMDFPYTSARFQALMGYTRDEIEALGEKILDRVDPGDWPRIQEAIERSRRDLCPVQVRFRLRHPDHGTLWLEASAGEPKAQGGRLTWVAALHDVTSDVKREQDLRGAHRAAEKMRARNEQQALHDGLTGLPNRRYFDDIIAGRLARAKSGGPSDCTLVRLDLDRFKHVNDTLGHAAGDRVLLRVAEVLRDCVRVGDFPSRNGGDEFSILMAPGAGEAEAREVVDRVHRRLAEPLIHEGRQCRFGVSSGIAHAEDILEIGHDIHLFADAALHRAKLEGGNRAEVFTPRLHSEIRRDRALAIDIHEAIDNDELVPFFQPQIAAADGSLHGAEVLLRWNHKTDGIIAPGAFMHVAEQLRLVPDIDRIVMEKSCDVLSRWRAGGLVVPKISFNVSSGRMHDPAILEFAARFAEIDTQVTFELLESILVEEENQAFRDNLDTVRAAGVDIEIDDFGSGHASIIGLMEIEPSALKIDQRIVFPVVRDPRARDLVHAIVAIAEALGINTVAEGVETEEHVRVLRELGCGVLQGYHFAKPLSEAEFLSYARARHDPAA